MNYNYLYKKDNRTLITEIIQVIIYFYINKKITMQQ